ncbi:MAG: hypothetical protein ACOX20_03700 [Limnochordia bacterium]
MSRFASRELLYLVDQAKAHQLMAKCLNQTATQCQDSELQSICKQMAQDHQDIHMRLNSFINQA